MDADLKVDCIVNLSLGQQRSLLDWLRLIHHHGRNRAKSSRGGLVKGAHSLIFSGSEVAARSCEALYLDSLDALDADEREYSLPELLRRYIHDLERCAIRRAT
jgi:hypothetical protein